MRQPKIVNLFSGGMDSYIISKIFNVDVNLHIDFNEYYSQKQRAVVKLLDPDNRRHIDGPNLRQFVADDGVFLPNRNALFITLASLYGDVILLGATAGAQHPDKDAEFANMMSQLLTKINKRKVEVKRPFGKMTKFDIIGSYMKAGFPIEKLVGTTSCYHPELHECLDCRSCLRRLVAFARHGFRQQELSTHRKRIADLMDRNEWSSNYNEVVADAEFVFK